MELSIDSSRRPRRWLLTSVAMVVALVLAGCGTAEGGDKGSGDGPLAGTTMAYTNATDAAPLYVTMRDGVKAAARRTGVDLETYDNKLDAATVSQNATLIGQAKPDFVLSYNPVEGVYTSIERIYQRAGIPCIAVNTPGKGYCKWFNLSNPQLCTDTAKAVGTVAKERGWTGDDTTVLLVNAASFGEQINNCNAYFYREIAKWIPGLQQIDDVGDLTTTTATLGDSMVQVDGQAQRAPSYDAVRRALSGIPADRNLVVYSVADDSTLGAWQAVEQSGRAKTSLTAGLGGSPEALAQLRDNPGWVAQGDMFIGHWGQYLMAMAAAVNSGADLPFQTLAPEAVLTKDFAVKDSIVAPVTDYYRDGEHDAYQLPPLVPVADGETVFGTKTVGNGYLADTGVLQMFGNVKGLE
ncbi:hypothetical protein GCM10022237_33810 [Nocardioides ginsengisoli]|uniref:Sugar ABC transporter substrate-binding protein n=1 Tax=Nocardioides ginsengisoli TaxID=363868 RepID=A0ABW3VWU5_9ACTN